MRLISCHIENFGKLHDYTIDFEKGANLICEENGWGKSTIAAFIRAMFYGLDGERKRNLEENERKRYTPWQGGVFGGQLTFEVDDKQYTVTRTFHEQEEFELRDAKTNLLSADYSRNLGEELFKVDRTSFLRTVFIAQADCETAATDDINAKIGNLTDNSNDLNNFETASARLKDLINSLTPNRKTGSLAQRKSEITELERKVTAQKGIPEALQKLQDRRVEELRVFNQLKEELEVVQKEQIRVSKLQRTLAKKEQWDNLKQEVQNSRQSFPGNVPVIADIEGAQVNESELKKTTERLAMYEMTEGEKEQLAALQLLFHKEALEESAFVEQLNNVKELSRVKNELFQEQLKQAEQKGGQEQKNKRASWPVGVIVLIVGIILCLTVGIIIGLPVTAVGIVMTIISAKKHKASKDMVQEATNQNSEKLERQAQELQQNISAFLERFGIYAAEENFVNHLHELKEKAKQYAFLNSKKDNRMKAQGDYENYRNQIFDFLEQHGFEPAHNVQLQLLNIRDAVQAHAEAVRKLELFEKETDTNVFVNMAGDDKSKNLSELNANIQSMTEEREVVYKRLEGYQADIEQLQAQLEEWEEHKIRLEEMQALQEDEQRKFHHIQKVQEYLVKAKESITNRYAAPILENFTKYYEMITSDNAEKFHIDANINITVAEQGKQRETNTQSSGYRDLIGICLRVALVDAMYTDEKPVLIMDDPFTNLDDAKMKQARKFLEYVAEKYQVIYFTCSESRR